MRGQKHDQKGALREPRLRNRSREVVLEYQGLDAVVRRTVLRSSPVAHVMLPAALHFSLHLPPKEERVLKLNFGFELDNQLTTLADYVHGLASASAEAGPDKVPR